MHSLKHYWLLQIQLLLPCSFRIPYVFSCVQGKFVWYTEISWKKRLTNFCISYEFSLDTSFMVVLLVGHRMIHRFSPRWTPLHSGLGQAMYSCVPLSPSSIIWYQPRGSDALRHSGTAFLAESNGSLPPCLWLSHLRLTAKRSQISSESKAH